MRRLFGQSCLLDTNVLAYALDRSAPHFPKASALVAACVQGQISGVVAQQNLLELTNVLTTYYRVPLAEAIEDIKAFVQQPRLSIIWPSSQTLTLFLQLARTIPDKTQVFDLYLAATMKENGVPRIVTANVKDFQGLPDLHVIDLAALTM